MTPHPTSSTCVDQPPGTPPVLETAATSAQLHKATGCRDEAGMTTAEYAVGTLAAVAFAVVLMTVVRSGGVQSALAAVIQAALAMGQ